jgi:HK97 gp10 family phage protein
MAGVSGRIRVKSWRSREITEAIEREMRKRLFLIGARVSSHARKLVSPSTRANGPSLPGEPPHADTGRFRNSISHDVTRDAEGHLVARVGSNVEYAPFLELGTNKMEARPSLIRSIDDLRDKIKEIIRRPFRMKG